MTNEIEKALVKTNAWNCLYYDNTRTVGLIVYED